MQFLFDLVYMFRKVKASIPKSQSNVEYLSKQTPVGMKGKIVLKHCEWITDKQWWHQVCAHEWACPALLVAPVIHNISRKQYMPVCTELGKLNVNVIELYGVPHHVNEGPVIFSRCFKVSTVKLLEWFHEALCRVALFEQFSSQQDVSFLEVSIEGTCSKVPK